MGKVYVYGRGDQIPDGVVAVNVTSRSKDEWSRRFSPFFIGPLEVEPYDDNKKYESKVFENAYQYLKLYPNKTKQEHLAWAKEGWTAKDARRFPMGRGAKPLCAMWKGSCIGYVESRFKIYAPLYASCVEKYTENELKQLKDILESGKDIALFDYDGYNYIYNNVTLEDVIYNTKRKMGHAFVLAMMLTNNRVWEKPYDKTKEHSSSMKRSKV